MIVKLPGAKGGRGGYFIARSGGEEVARGGVEERVREGLVKTPKDAIVQEYLIGVPVYIHYFHSPILGRVEILGADIRYETNIDGLRRLTPDIIVEMGLKPPLSLWGTYRLYLGRAYYPGSSTMALGLLRRPGGAYRPESLGPSPWRGVIDDEANIRIFEFSGRIVAGTNLYVYGSPYSYLYWGEPMSMVGGLLGRLGWPLRGTSSIGWSHEVQRWELTEWLQAWRGFSAHSSIASHSALDVFDGG